MKKLILTTAAVLTSLNLFAQGTVTFSNVGGNLVLNADNADAPVAAADGVVAALYYAPIGGTTFNIVANSTTTVGVPLAGYIFSTAALSTGGDVVPGAQAQFYVRAWESSFGSYEAALGTGLTGESAIWTQGTGGGGSPPGAPVSTVGFLPSFSVSVVPEPSAIALGLLGAGALLLLRRRK
jgi:MYXO-CTERM domain-containing protein